MKINKIKTLIIISIIIVLTIILLFTKNNSPSIATDPQINLEPKIISDREVILDINPQATYGELMKQASTTPETANAIFNTAQDVYDLSKIRAGKKIKLIYDKDTNIFKKLVYQINTEEELYVTLQKDNTWEAERKSIEYKIQIKTSEGFIESSLYETGLEQNIDEIAIIQLADVFQWTIDFAMNIKTGDYFKFIYEERYLDGEYVMPGEILAAKFINNGREYKAYYFEKDKENYGHYNELGKSMQKIFLKAPVAYKYISSGFTTGLRYVQAFNVSTKHRAIDYAAPYGTPIKAVGDGTVVRASWNGGYGNFISIRHNSTYTTNYAHLSKYAVSYGQKVTQGQTIGYVGSTGFSTGPHVHYEMVKHGTKINPQTEDFPSIEGIAEEDKKTFNKIIEKYKPILSREAR
jgi:murein DD-endopeptidase MepM/ murein hydrolase activator NlpD